MSTVNVILRPTIEGHIRSSILRSVTYCLIHDVTDPELDSLYKKCLRTAFPSFVEGWGLPVGEHLAHGKICPASAVAGIPESGR